MAKRINISVSDELHSRLMNLKDEMHGSHKVSKVCQRAIQEHLDSMEKTLFILKTLKPIRTAIDTGEHEHNILDTVENARHILIEAYDDDDVNTMTYDLSQIAHLGLNKSIGYDALCRNLMNELDYIIDKI